MTCRPALPFTVAFQLPDIPGAKLVGSCPALPRWCLLTMVLSSASPVGTDREPFLEIT